MADRSPTLLSKPTRVGRAGAAALPGRVGSERGSPAHEVPFGVVDARLSVLKLAVVVATTGRPRTSRLTVERLASQSRPADRILVVAVTPADVSELAGAPGCAEIHFAPRGSSHQRNHALTVLGGESDLVVFLDDDFLPADDYFAKAEALFLRRPDIAGATGRIIADGAGGPGIGFEDALAMLAADRLSPPGSAAPRAKRALYGCNMVVRAAAIDDIRFDENLPLYAWQEDIDFSVRVGRRGLLVESGEIAGVHMGEKSGRTSGCRLGYSQIANPVYLLGKGTIPPDLARRIMLRNVAANLLRSLAPEPYLDRRGRLWGNLIAIRDAAIGRLDPLRILDMG